MCASFFFGRTILCRRLEGVEHQNEPRDSPVLGPDGPHAHRTDYGSEFLVVVVG